jgi:hypothetical protein
VFFPVAILVTTISQSADSVLVVTHALPRLLDLQLATPRNRTQRSNPTSYHATPRNRQPSSILQITTLTHIQSVLLTHI